MTFRGNAKRETDEHTRGGTRVGASECETTSAPLPIQRVYPRACIVHPPQRGYHPLEHVGNATTVNHTRNFPQCDTSPEGISLSYDPRRDGEACRLLTSMLRTIYTDEYNQQMSINPYPIVPVMHTAAEISTLEFTNDELDGLLHALDSAINTPH